MANRPFVYLSYTVPPEALEQLRAECDIREGPEEGETVKEGMKKNARGAHGLIVTGGQTVDAEVLDAIGPQLKVVATISTGLDHLDLQELRKRAIAVGYTPGLLTKAVAELAIGLVLATARRMKEAMAEVQKGVWAGTRKDKGLWMTGLELAGSTVGIVGLGRIGTAVAQRIKAFEPARILYCGHSAKAHASEVGAELVSFPELLKSCDAVIATCSVTADNRHLFNKDAFSQMKPSAIFVNVTRGQLVDQDALLQALTSGQIGGAGLDVASPEPLPTNHPLLQLANCIVLPHIGASTRHTRIEACRLSVNNVLAGLRGKALPSPVP